LIREGRQNLDSRCATRLASGDTSPQSKSPVHAEAVILLGGIGFQPVRNTANMTGWKPIPRLLHTLLAIQRNLKLD
jgi:hypothetical protein